MEYRHLGRSGLEVSVVGLGCNNFGRRLDYEGTEKVVHAAIGLGITLFDTADIYGGEGRSEEYLGRALEGKRHEVLIATKFGNKMGEGPMERGGSRMHIMRSIEGSLRRLRTDYIDLYQVHVPDPSTPMEETLRALDDLVRQGKVRYIGNSNFAGWQVAEGHYIAEREHLTPFISAQNQYNLLDRHIERELAPACEKYGLGIIPYFPLASGFLTGKYRRDEPKPEGARLSGAQAAGMAAAIMTDANFGLLEKLEGFAEARGRSLLDLAIGWLASKPSVGSVIAGATKPEQLEANVRAAEWKLTPEEMAEADALRR